MGNGAEFDRRTDWGHVGCGDARTLRRDYLFYHLIEVEGALVRTLPELSQQDAATVSERLGRLSAKVV